MCSCAVEGLGTLPGVVESTLEPRRAPKSTEELPRVSGEPMESIRRVGDLTPLVIRPGGCSATSLAGAADQ
eukprot:2030261-Alexandrium_andersonii.AAC.1